MIDIKKYLWLVVLLAGILGIISIFSPVLHISSEDAYIWVWNLYSSNNSIGFVQIDEPLFTLGIVSTIILAIGTVILLFSGITLKIKNRDLIFFNLIGGGLLLIGSIIYLAGITIEEQTFWEYASVSIGSILPIIAGILAIIGGILGILLKKDII